MCGEIPNSLYFLMHSMLWGLFQPKSLSVLPREPEVYMFFFGCLLLNFLLKALPFCMFIPYNFLSDSCCLTLYEWSLWKRIPRQKLGYDCLAFKMSVYVVVLVRRRKETQTDQIWKEKTQVLPLLRV